MGQVKKFTNGYVVQKWDVETGKFLGQEFVAGDEVAYEDENGDRIDVDDDFFEKYPYREFSMVQNPEEGFTFTGEAGDRELEGYARRAKEMGSDFLDHDQSMS